jgi:hypothetical protein
MRKINAIPRGTLARKSREKRLAQRKKQDLSDLPKNTRKRRRLARRLNAEQPLFAFDILRSQMPGYDVFTFDRDCWPTRKQKGKRKPISARMELHNLLISKLDPTKPSNKLVTKIMLNWENINKPFKIEFRKHQLIYTFPKHMALSHVQRIAMTMQTLQTIHELDEYWKKNTSYGA